MNYDEILSRTKSDGFIAKLGIQITDLAEGYCRGELPLDASLNNPYGSVHGGCIFTLADTIGGSAALTRGAKVVTLDSTIHYLRPAIHTEKLIAEAREIKYGSTVAVYEVSITNAQGELLSTVLLSFFILADK